MGKQKKAAAKNKQKRTMAAFKKLAKETKKKTVTDVRDIEPNRKSSPLNPPVAARTKDRLVDINEQAAKNLVNYRKELNDRYAVAKAEEVKRLAGKLVVADITREEHIGP